MNYKSLFLFIVLALATAQLCSSQCLTINFIKNPNLEDYTCCPNNMAMIDCASFWSQPLSGNSTSDYFNNCGIDSLLDSNMIVFFEHSYFGSGYAGIITFSYDPNVIPPGDYREYIQGALSSSLNAGECYYCEFWVEAYNWGDAVPYCTNDALGVFFSDTLPRKLGTDPMSMIFTAQINNPSGRIISDTNSWIKISGSFTATGGEKFITVGNFKPVVEINNLFFGVPQFARSYYFFDNFSLCPCSDTLPPEGPANVIFLPNVFSPNEDGKNDFFYAKGENISQLDLKIYSRWGNLVFETIDPAHGWDGRFHGKDCAEGVYFYTASVTFKDGTVEAKKGNVTIIR